MQPSCCRIAANRSLSNRTYLTVECDDCNSRLLRFLFRVTLAEFGPIEVRLRGLQYMNDDPSAVDVLYAKVESEPLQRIADQIMEYFIANGLIQRQYGHVKLHATLINSGFNRHHRASQGEEGEEKRPHHNRHHRDSFDATAIMREFGEFDFGATKVTEIHLSQRFSTACNGFYEATGLVKL